jgi:GT2 family glycosyltransferase
LSVVVPATDAPPTLSLCVRAIEAAVGPDDEVIVVQQHNLGPAEARNLGAAGARGEVLVFVDSDVLVRGDSLERLRGAFARDRELVAMFGAYDDEPWAPDPVSGFRNLLHHCVHRRGAGAASTFWAGLGAVRRETFFAVGGFDAARFPRPSVEDIELGTRLASSGGRIALDPEVQGTHLKAWTLSEMIWTDFARRGVPWAEMIIERAARANALNVGWRNRLSALAVILVPIGALRRRATPAAAGIAALVVLNADFYRLLLRRRGPVQAVTGVPLHVIHLSTAILAVPAALARRLIKRLGASRR